MNYIALPIHAAGFRHLLYQAWDPYFVNIDMLVSAHLERLSHPRQVNSCVNLLNLFELFVLLLLPLYAFTAHGIYHQALVLVPVLALAPLLALDIGLLDNKDTTVNGVDNNVSALKGVGRPGTSVPESVTTAGLDIIRRVDIEISNLLDLGTVGELGDAGDVEDTETSLVVGLVVKTVVDVLVVVNGAGSGLVVASDDGLLEVLDIPDVGHSESYSSS
jgi:hypothetical protein